MPLPWGQSATQSLVALTWELFGLGTCSRGVGVSGTFTFRIRGLGRSTYSNAASGAVDVAVFAVVDAGDDGGRDGVGGGARARGDGGGLGAREGCEGAGEEDSSEAHLAWNIRVVGGYYYCITRSR